LHATRLALEHPVSGERMEWHVPLPQDMQQLLQQIRKAISPRPITLLDPTLPAEGSLRSSGEPTGVPLAGAGGKITSSPDGTTSHSTRLSKGDSQVAGYDKGRPGGV